jgi:hypothetical protein
MELYKVYEERIKKCSSEDELLKIQSEVYKLIKKNPDLDSDKLFFLIADRKKYLLDHMCDPWKLRKKV